MLSPSCHYEELNVSLNWLRKAPMLHQGKIIEPLISQIKLCSYLSYLHLAIQPTPYDCLCSQFYNEASDLVPEQRDNQG